MARSLSIIGFLALAIGLLWIGQGTGAIRWPQSSFMINQLQWAGYGAMLGAVGLILIWQGRSIASQGNIGSGECPPGDKLRVPTIRAVSENGGHARQTRL